MDGQQNRPDDADEGAASALNVNSIPEAREKLIAARRVTPSASSTAEVVPMLTIAPPAVIGKIDVAAARQITTRANGGENPTPSALRSKALPRTRIVQQPIRKPPATNVDREMPAWFPTRMKACSTRAERLTNGSRTSRGPSRRAVMHPRQKSSTTISGARKLGPLVASAATASGSIATASRIRWKVSAAYRYPTEPSI